MLIYHYTLFTHPNFAYQYQNYYQRGGDCLLLWREGGAGEPQVRVHQPCRTGKQDPHQEALVHHAGTVPHEVRMGWY